MGILNDKRRTHEPSFFIDKKYLDNALGETTLKCLYCLAPLDTNTDGRCKKCGKFYVDDRR